MGSQQFCLKWNNHQSNMLAVFDQLLATESFVDVTIACDGVSMKAHKMVLSACSPYFQKLFVDNPCQHPIVILKDIRYDEMKSLIDFMYKGEVNVSQEQLSVLLKTAEALKVKGLTEVTTQNTSKQPPEQPVPSQQHPVAASTSLPLPPPPPPPPPPLQESVERVSPVSRRKRKSCSSGGSSGNAVASKQSAAMLHHEVQSVPQPPPPPLLPLPSTATDDGFQETSFSQRDAVDNFRFMAQECVKEELPDIETLDSTDITDSPSADVIAEHMEFAQSQDYGTDSGNTPLSKPNQMAIRLINVYSSTAAGTANDSGGPSTSSDKKPKERKKASWTVTDLMQAIEAVRSGQMNVLKAAVTFGIPKSSLYDYINGRSGSRLRLSKRFSRDAFTLSRLSRMVGQDMFAMPNLSSIAEQQQQHGVGYLEEKMSKQDKEEQVLVEIAQQQQQLQAFVEKQQQQQLDETEEDDVASVHLLSVVSEQHLLEEDQKVCVAEMTIAGEETVTSVSF